MDQLQLFKDVQPTGHKQSRRRSADLPVNKVNKEVAKDRYYLHKQLKKSFKGIAEIKIHGAERIIDVPYCSFEEVPVGPRYYIGQLIELRYLVQYKVFSDQVLTAMKKEPNTLP